MGSELNPVERLGMRSRWFAWSMIAGGTYVFSTATWLTGRSLTEFAFDLDPSCDSGVLSRMACWEFGSELLLPSLILGALAVTYGSVWYAGDRLDGVAGLLWTALFGILGLRFLSLSDAPVPTSTINTWRGVGIMLLVMALPGLAGIVLLVRGRGFDRALSSLSRRRSAERQQLARQRADGWKLDRTAWMLWLAALALGIVLAMLDVS